MNASPALVSMSGYEKDKAHASVPERCRECAAQGLCAFFTFPEFHSKSERRFYARECTVLHQDAPARRAFLVRTGWMHLTHLTPEGKAIVSLAGPGALVGFQEVLSGGAYLTSARTLEESELESIESARLLAFLEEHPLAAVSLLKALSIQWQKSLSRLYDLASKVPADRRLLRALCEIAGTCGCSTENGVRIKVPVSIQMLADIIGCSRQWISTLLSDLEQRGLIRHKSGWITLHATAFAD